jgi:hypothetical protein
VKTEEKRRVDVRRRRRVALLDECMSRSWWGLVEKAWGIKGSGEDAAKAIEWMDVKDKAFSSFYRGHAVVHSSRSCVLIIRPSTRGAIPCVQLGICSLSWWSTRPTSSRSTPASVIHILPYFRAR